MTTTISGSNGIVFPDLTSMQTGQQAVKAWVNFNGTGVVAIRAGYNVASITDNGTGNYTVNFTTAMTDVNYSFTFGGKITSGSGVSKGIIGQWLADPTTSALQIASFADNFAAFADNGIVNVTIFR